MANFRLLGVAAAASTLLGVPAVAEDLAVILSNLSYRTQPDLPSGPATDRMERALQAAGFSTIAIQNMTLGTAATRLDQMRQRVEQADRLVFVVNGLSATSDGKIWLLAPEAGLPTDFTVGTMALPVSPFLAQAAEHAGAGLVVMVEQVRLPRVGAGVTAGFAAPEVPQGVTFLSGRAEVLAELFEAGLFDNEVSMSEALAAHPDVHPSGFIATLSPFMPLYQDSVSPVNTVTATAPSPAQPAPSAEERQAAAERSLGLSREERMKVQRSLAILGFDPRGIDGLFGPASRRAISAYQADRGFEATGYLTRALISQLTTEGDARAAQLEAEAARRQAEADARDTAYWRDTGQGADETGIRAYLRRYPDGLFADVANGRLRAIEDSRRPQVNAAEQRDWDAVRAEDTARSYRAYLDAYPQGAFVTEAQDALEARLAEADAEEANKAYAEEERRVAGNTVARKLVENRLTALGLDPGPIDGEFDEDTRRALRRYQEARGLDVTGYVDQATMVRLLIGN